MKLSQRSEKKPENDYLNNKLSFYTYHVNILQISYSPYIFTNLLCNWK